MPESVTELPERMKRDRNAMKMGTRPLMNMRIRGQWLDKLFWCNSYNMTMIWKIKLRSKASR